MLKDGVGSSNRLRWLALGLALGHLLIVGATTGLNTSDYILDAGLLALVVRPETYSLLELAVPIWLFGVAYFDVLPQALRSRGPIHVADVYSAELSWFGVEGLGGRSVPSALFRDRHWPAIDLACGVVYMTELIQPLLLAAWLFVFDRPRLPRLVWAFLLLNLAAFATWVLFPAAPPWYVDEYGLGPAVLDAPSNAAGLLRVDDVLGLSLIHDYYAQSVNVFGAMPSVHVAVPTLVACVTAGMGWRWYLPALVFLGLMSFGAVYFQHHYVIDVLAGMVFGLASYAIVTAAGAFAARHRATVWQPVAS